jgi:hypothetical protein
VSEILIERWERLPELVNADARLVHRGRLVTLEALIGIGEHAYHVGIERGRITALLRGPFLVRSWRFAVRGPAESWRRHWEAVPEPHFHDLFALAKARHLTIEGDVQPLMANLCYFKDVLAAPRRLAGGH